jgi:imidazole glycerol-phosphate synthase subunit HisH
MSAVVVVDYGMGNLGSVAKALEHVSGKKTVKVSSQAQEILAAERIVFPGQGAMPDCMRFLRESGLLETVLRVSESKPLFGVCVGEQMLFEISDEGNTPGLGLFAGKVQRFSGVDADANRLKVPHMGWNRVAQVNQSKQGNLPEHHALFAGIPDQSYFYFVHSFYVAPKSAELIVALSDYGDRFTCAVAKDNIFATQFHPEKSAALGLKMYENFLSWQP